MTHFIGAVVVPARHAKGFHTVPTAFPGLYGDDALEVVPDDDLNVHLDEVLEPFDEAKTVERWISREDLIATSRKRSNDRLQWESYQAYLSDPEAYKAKYASNQGHLEYFETGLPAEIARSDDEVYAAALNDYEDPPREDGAVLDTYNPQSKWDWWTLGGRWESIYRERQGQTVGSFLADLKVTRDGLAAGANLNPHKDDPFAAGADLPWYFPHHLLTPDGEWLEIGQVGWFGARNDDKSEAEWVDTLIAALEKIPETDAVFYIDFHI